MRPILKMVFTLFRVGNKTMKIHVSCHDAYKCTLLLSMTCGKEICVALPMITFGVCIDFSHASRREHLISLLSWISSNKVSQDLSFLLFSILKSRLYRVREKERERENRWTIKRNIQANLRQFSGMFFQPRKSRLNSYKIKWNETFAFDSLYVLCWMCFGSSGAALRTCECV